MARSCSWSFPAQKLQRVCVHTYLHVRFTDKEQFFGNRGPTDTSWALEGLSGTAKPLDNAIVKRLASKPLLLDVDAVVANLDLFQGRSSPPTTLPGDPLRVLPRWSSPSPRLRMLRILPVASETCSPGDQEEEYTSLLHVIGISLAVGTVGGGLIGHAAQQLIAGAKRRMQARTSSATASTEVQEESESAEADAGEAARLAALRTRAATLPEEAVQNRYVKDQVKTV